MTSRADLRALLQTETRIDPNAKIFTNTQNNTALQSAYLQVQKDWNFSWRENAASDSSITIVGWTQEYSLPSDFIRLELVTFDTQNLFQRDFIELKREIKTFTQWTPNEYFIRGTNIWLNPIPGIVKTLELFYRKRLPSLSDSQDSILPSDFDQAIITYAAYFLWKTTSNRQKETDKLQEYKLLIETLRTSYLEQDNADMNFRNQRFFRFGSFRSDTLSLWRNFRR